jgi:hypothetical protein
MSPEIASTWLKLTGKKRSREFLHSLGQFQPVTAPERLPRRGRTRPVQLAQMQPPRLDAKKVR